MKTPIEPTTALTEKQQAFCREYLTDFNATQAAIRAGYSRRSAKSIGNENLTKPDIQKYLATLQKPALEQFEVTQERIMLEITTLAFSNIFDFLHVCEETGIAWIDLTKCTRQQAAALSNLDIIEIPLQKFVEGGQEITHEVLRYKIRLHDKLKALECLMKRYSMTEPERVDVNVQHNFNDMSQSERLELAQRIAFILRKAAEDKKKIEKLNEDR